ncbi:unnamed protein product [Effrenium voratum]|nr:unnamed protein product [Effrenium voratum]
MVAEGDAVLQQILRRRLLCSEGAENDHCYTKEPAQGSADAVCQPLVSHENTGHFSMDAEDTPPPSPKHERHTEILKPEDEAESTDGLPEGQAEVDDLHYDWQFELMNSMPREKALELARVLKRSEQEKARESAKLRQDLVELKRQMSREQPRSQPAPRCGFLFWAVLGAVVVAVAAAAVVAWPLAPGSPAQANPLPQEKPPTAPVQDEAAASSLPPPAPANMPGPDVATTTPAPSPPPPPPPPPPPAKVPEAHRPMPRPAMCGAEVVRGSSHLDLWHPSLSQDVAAVGPVRELALQSTLKQVLSGFPNIGEVFRFCSLHVSRGKLDGQQVALQATMNVINSGVIQWPERTQLKLIHGLGMGLPSLLLWGHVLPGQHLELLLQLEVPNRGKGDGSDVMRNMWVLVDGRTDEPFGPLLVAEAGYPKRLGAEVNMS